MAGRGMSPLHAGLGVALLAMATAVTARADPVPPPPDECPAGTVGNADHYGPYCMPSPCKSDGDCRKDQTCQPSALCVVRKTYTHPRGDTHRVSAEKARSGSSSCPDGATYEEGNYCVRMGWMKRLFGCDACSTAAAARQSSGDLSAISLLGLLALCWRRRGRCHGRCGDD